MEILERTASLLGGREVLGEIPRDAVAAARMIREGLPSKTLDCLRSELSTSIDELARALHLSKRTLERRLEGTSRQRRSRRLNDTESERIFRFARVNARAEDVFGTLDKAQRWLRQPNRALGGQVPLMLLDSDVGSTAVEDVLARIEYGVVS